MKKSFALTLASTLILASCASSNDAITARVDLTNGAPLYRSPPAPQKSPLELRAEAIYSAADDELAKMLRWGPPTSVTNVKVEKVNLATKVTFTSTPKGFFPPGAYALQHVLRSEDRSGVVFMDLVTTAMRKVVDRAKAEVGAGIDISFQATYSAQADGLPARTLRYKGEYGNVLLPSTLTTLNGKPVDVRIAKGQLINNAELAALRAVSLSSFVHGALDPYKIADKFVLTTTDARGLEERWVKVELTLTPAP